MPVLIRTSSLSILSNTMQLLRNHFEYDDTKHCHKSDEEYSSYENVKKKESAW